jgi:hypothetical protein
MRIALLSSVRFRHRAQHIKPLHERTHCNALDLSVWFHRLCHVVRLALGIMSRCLGHLAKRMADNLGWSAAPMRCAGAVMLRQVAECVGIALSAIGGALQDMSDADKTGELLRELDAYRAENARFKQALERAILRARLAEQATEQAIALRDAFAARIARGE